MTALGVLGFLVTLVLGSIFHGYVLSVLWGWFVVPTFGVPTLGLVSAIGLSLVVSYLTHQVPASRDTEADGERMVQDLLFAILMSAFALAFGWIIHLFM